MKRLIRLRRYMMGGLLFALALMQVSPPGVIAAIPQPKVDQPANRLRQVVHQLDDQLAKLLQQVPPASAASLSPTDIEITYLIMVRHFYRTAENTRNNQLRATLVMRADELAAAAKSFNTLVKSIFSANAAGATSPTPMMVSAYAALHRFQSTGRNINAHIRSVNDLHAYCRKVLLTLDPLVALDTTGHQIPNVWPPVPIAPMVPVATPTSANQPVPVTDVMVEIQQANLMPQVRRILRQIINQLKTGNPPHVAPANNGYYQLMLHAFSLAKNLQSSALLGLTTQNKLNHELLVGLLLFKDTRTRTAAIRRLDRLEFIVGALRVLNSSSLPPQTKLALGMRMHSAIRGLSHQSTRSQAMSHMNALQNMIKSYTAFNIAIQVQPALPQKVAWQQCVHTADKILKRATVILMDSYSNSTVFDTTRRLDLITGNLARLGAMPATQAQALVYHPVPLNGIQRNIVRWTRQIGRQPDRLTPGARHFDQMRSALAILAHIRLAMPRSAPTRIVRRLSDGKYDQFMALFVKTQQQMVNSLAMMHIAPDLYVSQLRRQLLLFRCTRDMARLESKDKPLRMLNSWGSWYLSSEGTSILNRELQEAVESQYIHATGGDSASDGWLTFDQAAPAIHVLATASTQVIPYLPAGAMSYSTLYLKAATFPPGNASLRSAMNDFQSACLWLNNAAFNEKSGRLEVSKRIFRHGISILGHAPVQ